LLCASKAVRIIEIVPFSELNMLLSLAGLSCEAFFGDDFTDQAWPLAMLSERKLLPLLIRLEKRGFASCFVEKINRLHSAHFFFGEGGLHRTVWSLLQVAAPCW